jgi:putative phage-type endonuclease
MTTDLLDPVGDGEADGPDLDPETEAFLAEQQSAITSTDVAKILGLSSYGTPLTVYLAKTGGGQQQPTSLRMWVGLRLEGLVSELYCTATGNRVRSDNGFYRHPLHPWLGTHLDRRVVGSPRLVVELKTRGTTRGWRPDGSAEVPVDVWTQVQIQMAVIGGEAAHVACLFSNSVYRTYTVPFDRDWFEGLVPELERYWYGHVVARVPPAPTGADADSRVVKSMGGGDTGLVKSATPAQEALAERLRLARAEAAAAATREAEAENLIKTAIGADADGLTGAFGTILWKRVRDSAKTDWKAVAAVWRRVIDGLLEDAAPGDDDEAVQRLASAKAAADAAVGQNTKTTPGVRRIDIRFREE